MILLINLFRLKYYLLLRGTDVSYVLLQCYWWNTFFLTRNFDYLIGCNLFYMRLLDQMLIYLYY